MSSTIYAHNPALHSNGKVIWQDNRKPITPETQNGPQQDRSAFRISLQLCWNHSCNTYRQLVSALIQAVIATNLPEQKYPHNK